MIVVILQNVFLKKHQINRHLTKPKIEYNTNVEQSSPEGQT